MATRRLIALLLILWLPFQAAAGTVMPACVGHGPARITAWDLAAQDVDAGHAHHADHDRHGGTAQPQSAATPDPADDQSASSDYEPCAYCVVLCAVYVPTQALSHAHGVEHTAPPTHGSDMFSSTAPSLAFKPPIAAAA